MIGLGPLEVIGIVAPVAIVAVILFMSRRRLGDSLRQADRFLHDFAALRDEVAALHDRFDALDRSVANLDARLSAFNASLTSPSEAVRAKVKQA